MKLKTIIKNFKQSVSNIDEDKIDSSLTTLTNKVKASINKAKEKIKNHL